MEQLNDVIEVEQENNFEIRNPKSTDIMAVIRIIGKMKIKSDILAMAGQAAEMNRINRKLNAEKKKKKNTEQLELELETIKTELGMQMPFILLENMDKAEGEVEKLFASLLGISEQAYRDLDADVTIDVFTAIKSNEKWNKVFTKALKLVRG